MNFEDKKYILNESDLNDFLNFDWSSYYKLLSHYNNICEQRNIIIIENQFRKYDKKNTKLKELNFDMDSFGSLHLKVLFDEYPSLKSIELFKNKMINKTTLRYKISDLNIHLYRNITYENRMDKYKFISNRWNNMDIKNDFFNGSIFTNKRNKDIEPYLSGIDYLDDKIKDILPKVIYKETDLIPLENKNIKTDLYLTNKHIIPQGFLLGAVKIILSDENAYIKMYENKIEICNSTCSFNDRYMEIVNSADINFNNLLNHSLTFRRNVINSKNNNVQVLENLEFPFLLNNSNFIDTVNRIMVVSKNDNITLNKKLENFIPRLLKMFNIENEKNIIAMSISSNEDKKLKTKQRL